MKTSKEWFTGSKRGLEKIARRRGLSYVLFELLQNSWDTGAKFVKVRLDPVPDLPLVDLQVEDDDPDGFADLTHAWTLFAESGKKNNPEKRGLFNFGEKLVLAICQSATITSTKGSVTFDERGRTSSRVKTQKGTIFHAIVRMTREELAEVMTTSRMLICPEGVSTTINGDALLNRSALKEVSATLPTVLADSDGVVRPFERKTTVRIHESLDGCEGHLYEMGIPVCPTGDPWDVEIMQKVPVNLERSGVAPAYLRTVRVIVTNAMVDTLTVLDVSSLAVRETIDDRRCAPEVACKVLEIEYGPKRAIFDLNDPEANNVLVAEGYKLIHGRSFSKQAWENIRSSGAALPSGQIRPTPKPYSSDPDAASRVLVPESEWSEGMRNIAEYSKVIAERIIGQRIRVVIDKGHRSQFWGACYGGRELTYNLATLGKGFFEEGPSRRVNSLLIHELAHSKESNHLSEKFHRALQTLGAKMTELALAEPDLFKGYGWRQEGVWGEGRREPLPQASRGSGDAPVPSGGSRAEPPFGSCSRAAAKEDS
jgi:hypothetical protein